MFIFILFLDQNAPKYLGMYSRIEVISLHSVFCIVKKDTSNTNIELSRMLQIVRGHDYTS